MLGLKYVYGYCSQAVTIKLLTADKLLRNNNNCATIMVLMLKGSRHSVWQSYFNCAFVAPTRLKHKASPYIKPEPKSPALLTILDH